MRVLPVLDLKGDVVVRGIAGRRDEYRPVVSRLTASAQPLDVARVFRAHFGLTELYLADLDAIAGAAPSLALYTRLHADGFRLWVDAGIHDNEDAGTIEAGGVERLVAGLETLAGPEALRRLCEEFGGERVVFSLDLKGGRPLSGSPDWGTDDPWSLARRAVDCGVRRLIVLDLTRVGVSAGTGTEELCGRLTTAYPQVEVVAGGGVRGPGDLLRLRQCGVRGVLIASALHDGRLTAEDLKAFGGPR
jgi:phosphoribosylformimino-5-aminoimidazole carboxamide ribotide isomerase